MVLMAAHRSPKPRVWVQILVPLPNPHLHEQEGYLREVWEAGLTVSYEGLNSGLLVS
jgi:hypothetical protein